MAGLEPSLNAAETADREWPELRSRLIEIAATLDRLDRSAGDASETRRRAEAVMRLLLDASTADRARRALELLSREYDPAWRDRFAAGAVSADPAAEG